MRIELNTIDLKNKSAGGGGRDRSKAPALGAGGH